MSPEFLAQVEKYWLHVAVALNFILAACTTLHAVLYKRDPRSAVAWVSLAWLSPVIGSLTYIFFGINRIERKAVSLRRRRRRIDQVEPKLICTEQELTQYLGPEHAHLVAVSRVGEKVYQRPLLEGNSVEPLVNGEQAYPAMLAAIDGASSTVTLLAYIFEKDEVGERFIEAVKRAVERKVEVRVLIDGVGGGSTLRASIRAFRAVGAQAEVFLPMRLPWRNRYMNLRNHRKILVVDGRIGFTGGMNIRRSHCLSTPGPHHEQDLHFRIEGPVVEHLQEAFVDDWAFATGEALLRGKWFAERPEAKGPVSARGVPFDPGEKLDTLRNVLVGALSAARRSIRIMSPYFLPEPALISALNVAALRGVEVDILIPERNDSRVVQWAMEAQLWQVLSGGCRVWRTPPPFEHSKLMTVDGAWTFLGSANFDPRSLRLNFEFNVECYDRALATRADAFMAAKRQSSKPVTLREVNSRPLPIKLRDGLARLFSPYL